MTCIVGLVDGDTVWMGADSCGSDGHRNDVYPDSKLFLVGPDQQPLLFGATGSFRTIDVLRYRLDVPVRNEKTEDANEWVRTSLVDAIREAFNECGALKTSYGVVSIEGPVMVATEGRLWTVQNDLSVLDSPRHGDVVGSGIDAARGSLFSTFQYDIAPRDRVRLALETAAALISTVSPPFAIRTL